MSSNLKTEIKTLLLETTMSQSKTVIANSSLRGKIPNFLAGIHNAIHTTLLDVPAEFP